MSIELNWAFLEDNEDATNVYRSLTPIDENALPTPLVTLTNGERSYVDETTENLTVYHYRFGKVVGGVETLSGHQPEYSSRYTGPGPQTLQSGNFPQLGFFGEVLEDDFLSAKELATLVNFDPDNNIGTLFEDRQAPWFKLFHNNTVKYIRQSPIMIDTRWSDLYKAGLVFGTPGTHETEVSADIINAVGAHDQEKIIAFGLDRFRVRLIEGLAPSKEWVLGDRNIERNGSEWNELIYPLYGKQEIGGLTNKALGPNVMRPTTSSITENAFMACQETNGLNALYRHSTLVEFASQQQHNRQIAWFPVLEYLPNF